MTPAEEAAAKEASESKGVVKFGWVKGVLVSAYLLSSIHYQQIHFHLKCVIKQKDVFCHFHKCFLAISENALLFSTIHSSQYHSDSYHEMGQRLEL